MVRDVPALNVVEEVANAWCFAAVEQVLRKVFGKADITQTEIAHNAALRLAGTAGGSTFHWRQATEYAQKAFAQATVRELADVQREWNTIRPTVAGTVRFGDLRLDEDGLRALLQGFWGEIDLRPFTSALVEKPYDVFTITGELSDGKLVIAGSSAHWYVVYGYEYDDTSTAADETRKYRYLVYDVHGPHTTTPGATSFQNSITDMFSVGA
jgi:hypothetical protein